MIVHCDFIGVWMQTLFSHFTWHFNSYQISVQREKKKWKITKYSQKINYRSSSLGNEVRWDLRYDRPSGPASLGSSYLCLSGAEQKIWWSGSTGPFGKGSYLEGRDSLEDALIEQGRIKGDSQAMMGYSRRLYLGLFIFLNLSSQAKYK